MRWPTFSTGRVRSTSRLVIMPDAGLAQTSEYSYISSMFRAAIAALVLLVLPATTARAQQLELIYVDRSGCPWCHRFEQEAMGPYRLSELGQAAPLRRFSLDNGQPALRGLDEPVRFTPTFILLRDGREAARIIGYRDNATFFGLIERHVADQRSKEGG